MQPSDPQNAYNPYSPPAVGAPYAAPADVVGGQVLAERMTRLGAALLDGLLSFVCAIPGIVMVVLATMDTAGSAKHGRGSAGLDLSNLILPIVVIFALTLPLAGYQWYLVSKSGQTLGKRWTGIRIVKLDGSPVDFVSGVIMRIWIVSMAGFIPYVGSCVGLVDILMIFGDQRRCLHDQIAGTKVVVA